MTETLTPTERRVCEGLGLSPEQYLARKREAEERRRKATKEERIDALRRMQRSANASEREAIESQITQIDEEETENEE